MSIAETYIENVLSGKVVAGQLIIQACQRHRDDLETAEERDLYFDPAAGQRVIDFIEAFCIPSGQDTPLKLMPWQCAVLYVTYGWKRGDGTRRFRRCLVEVAKKSGKTEMAAALCIYHLVADGEQSARCFVAATSRKQAAICFKAACMMRDRSPELKEVLQKSGVEPVLALYIQATGSRLSAMSRDADTSDGALVSFSVLDELHRWPANSGLYSILRYGGRTRPQPMLFEITTAGSSSGGTSLCWGEHEYCQKILENHVQDDEVAAWIFSLDPADSWKDENVWGKSNPSLGYLYTIDQMRKEFAEVQGKPSSIGEFKRFCLNIWSSESENPAIELAKWDACSRVPLSVRPDPVKLRAETILEMRGRTCFAGLDLAPKNDTSSLVLLFPPRGSTDKFRILEFYWIPKENIAGRVRRDKVPYDLWEQQGFLVTTPGKISDPRAISDQIVAITKMYDLKELYFDSSWSNELVRMLEEAGFPMKKMVDFPQSHQRMNAPCQEWQRKILRQELAHDSNPVSRWQVSNLRWNTQKSTSFIKPDKDRKREKIDFVASCVMALAAAISPDNRPRPSFFVVTSA
jgi:phage terminase large subunit-like protein